MTFPRDRRGGQGQGSFVSVSKEKKTKDRAMFFSFASSASSFPPFPPTPTSPSCSLPRTWIHPHIHLPGEERKRSGLLHLLLRGKVDNGPLGVPLHCVALIAVPFTPCIILLPLLLPLLHHLTPRPGCVYVAWPDGLVVVFIISIRLPARLPRCVRCSLLRCAIH